MAWQDVPDAYDPQVLEAAEQANWQSQRTYKVVEQVGQEKFLLFGDVSLSQRSAPYGSCPHVHIG